jgi:hypothetical protein
MSFSVATTICVIASHGAPADHLATYIQKLPKSDYTFDIYASEPALSKFREKNIEVRHPFSLEQQEALAEQIAKACHAYSVVIADTGHPFAEVMQKALAQHAPKAVRIAYYDNPEVYVGGGYSKYAGASLPLAQIVLFSNSKLATTKLFQDDGKEIVLDKQKKVGLGYYPVSQADAIAERRKSEHEALRKQFLSKQNIQDTNQKVLVYFGANNTDYFQAFDDFLSLLEQMMKKVDASKFVVVLQQHPGAKKEDIDKKKIEAWKEKHPQLAPTGVVSDISSNDAQVIADAALYYQTSMGPQFVLAGIPTMQIGRVSYDDVLVRGKLCPSIATCDQLMQAVQMLDKEQKSIDRKAILEGLGTQSDWLETLKKVLKQDSNQEKKEQKNT